MNPEHLHLLQHSLGCDKHGETRFPHSDEGDGCFTYPRNRFVTDLTSTDGLGCGVLVAQGLMVDRGPQQIATGMHLFQVTAAGVEAMKRHSLPKPKLTRGQRMYQEFLDADCGWSFGEYLKWRHANRDRIRALGYS